MITKVQGKLVDAGLSFLKNVHVPPVSRTITIIDTEGLAEARSYVSILDTLSWVLPVLGVLALAGSALIVPARRHRRLTVRAALVLVAACAFTLVLLAIGRSLYLDATVNKDAAKAVFDILVRNLRYGVITLAVVGVIVALVAYFAGPSAPAKFARRYADKGISGARNKAGDLGLQPNPVEEFVGAHKRVLELVIAGLAGGRAGGVGPARGSKRGAVPLRGRADPGRRGRVPGPGIGGRDRRQHLRVARRR